MFVKANDGYIFGGFNPTSWVSEFMYSECNDAYLFSVTDGQGRKPAEICTPRTEELRGILIKEEYVLNEGLKNADVHEDEDEGTGSASDSE